MVRLQIKPLSVNKAYKGQKHRTPEHDRFKRNMAFLLPNIKLPPPPYCIHFKFGFSSASSDGDNCIKLAQDSISEKYGFNDKVIRRWIVDAVSVPKGQEFIEFKIESLI